MHAAFSWAPRVLISLTLLSLVLTSQSGNTQTATAAQCVNCHSKVTPNIVSDWRLSKHSGVEVTCVDCHGDQHTSASDVSKAKIPTPETCAQCHETQVDAIQERQARFGLGFHESHADHPLAADGHDRGRERLWRMPQDRRQDPDRGTRTSRERFRHRIRRGAMRRLPHPPYVLRRGSPLSRRLARPATWASTIRSGRCIPPQSTGCGMS